MKLFLKNVLFTLVVPGVVAVYLPVTLANGGVGDVNGQWVAGRSFGFVLLAAGTAVYLWCLWDFAAGGRGTPAPFDPPRALVVKGLYRIVRNPMYVGVETVILGWSVWFRSLGLLVYAGVVALLFHTFVVTYEEPALRKRFGAAYQRYCQAVGRWLPRCPPRGMP